MEHKMMGSAAAENVMDLSEVRRIIDSIDPQIRELLMRRMECSYQVAAAKNLAGETNVYRSDREAAILGRLGAEVPETLRSGYLAVVRKIMETSRMYQYGLLYDWNDGIFDEIPGSGLAGHAGSMLTISLSRPDRPNAMSEVLSMIGDYGFDMETMTRLECPEEGYVSFALTIRGDISATHMRKLIFQLYKESRGLRILRNE